MGNREALLVGAKQCLTEKGYAASTVRDIAGAAGVSMAAIGYHFGSREELLNLALFDLIDQWGGAVADAHAGGVHDQRGYAAMWSQMIESFTADRTLFVASVEAALLGTHAPTLREQVAGGLAEGRRGLAAAVTGAAEDDLDPGTVRTLGSVHLALVTGVLMQWLTDPENAPTGDDVAAGLRALADRIDGRRAGT